MKYRKLANTDVTLSEVGFGVWTVSAGWWGEFTDDQAADLLRRALDLGVTFFDTGDTYGNGRGETLLAKAFKGRRDDVVIGTKFGYDFYTDTERRGQRERPHNWTPEFIRFALEQSLKRLGSDYVDFLQLHNTKMDAIENDNLFALMEAFKEEGKIRAYGVALGPKIGWLEEGVKVMRERRIDGLQMIYNLLEQDPGRDLIRAAGETGTSLVVRVPHSSGMLEGKYDENTTFTHNDHRRHRPKEWLTTGLKKVEQLGFLTEAGERTLGQAALKFVLASPEVASTLPNIYGEEQIEEFAATSETPDLTEEELSRLAELYENDFGLEEQSAGQRVS